MGLTSEIAWGLVGAVRGAVGPFVLTHDPAFLSLILNRPITPGGIAKLLGKIV